MRDFINSTIRSIKPSGIRKFFDIAAEMDDVISLGVGEPDFETPWNVRETAIYTLEQGRTKYTANAGLKELRIAIAEYTARKYGLSYDPLKQVLVTVGGSEAIDLAFRCILEPGDEVLLPTPSYVAYAPCAQMAGAVVRDIPLQAKNDFKLTVADLEKVWTPAAKILVLPFPNNPTGAVMTEEDLAPIRDFVLDKDLFVVSDEIYAELNYGAVPHVSPARLAGMQERTVVINGFSKAFSMTGWRLGYAMGPKEIIAQMTKLHQFAIMCAPTTSQLAAVEALKNCDDDVEAMRKEYHRRLRYILDRFAKMGIDCPKPEGAFYVFPYIGKFGLSSDEFCERLLYGEHVAVVPGNAFGEAGEGHVRISYAYSLEKLKLALDRIEHFISTL